MLQAGEERLASMFALFTRLARDEGMPGTEDLGTRSRWPCRWLTRLLATGLYVRDASRRSRPAGLRRARGPGVRWRALTLLPLAVAAAVATALIGISTTGMPACGPVPSGARLRVCAQPVRAGVRVWRLPVTGCVMSRAGARAVPARRLAAAAWPPCGR
jgi:hypothetical protein